jgi:hypothetical protein
MLASPSREVLFEYGKAKIAGLDPLCDANLQDLENLFRRPPAFSAFWVCRRVPGAYMRVNEASKAMLRSSISFAGRMPLP